MISKEKLIYSYNLKENMIMKLDHSSSVKSGEPFSPDEIF